MSAEKIVKLYLSKKAATVWKPKAALTGVELWGEVNASGTDRLGTDDALLRW